MIKKFEDITVINDRKLFDEIAEYEENLIQEATASGALEKQDADNEYTREIGRTGMMLADYESTYMNFKCLKFKSPLIIGIEKELVRRALKQREAAGMLNVKESTFSQVIRGKRPVSMQMAKRLYKVFNIDPKLILEYS
jgi:predicted XRE-type DNA-binding protein